MNVAKQYGTGHVLKPGHMPEPLKPLYRYDPPEIEQTCLSCPVMPDCRPKSKKCPLRGKGLAVGGKKETRWRWADSLGEGSA